MSVHPFVPKATPPEGPAVGHIRHIMPRADFPALCAKARTFDGCAHIQCGAILRLSRRPCTHCHQPIKAGDVYLVLARDAHEPTVLAHADCHGTTR